MPRIEYSSQVFVLRDGQHLLVHLLQRIDAQLQVDVVGRELGLQERVPSATVERETESFPSSHLIIGLTKLFLGVLEGPRSERGDLGPQVPGLVSVPELWQLLRHRGILLREALANALEIHDCGG